MPADSFHGQAGNDMSLQVQSTNHGKSPLFDKAHPTYQCTWPLSYFHFQA